jgi:tetratricopeptide (TPR) repeat protein
LKRAFVAEPMNFDIAYDTGEALRGLSWQGEAGYEKLAVEAIEWFQRANRLNPFDPYNFLRIGMCLDWQGNHEASAPYYEKALALDPNNYYLAALQGWHYIQIGDYLKAKEWLQRSHRLELSERNRIAVSYLSIVERKLKESDTPKQDPAPTKSEGKAPPKQSN